MTTLKWKSLLRIWYYFLTALKCRLADIIFWSVLDIFIKHCMYQNALFFQSVRSNHLLEALSLFYKQAFVITVLFV
jgi:hypothetical protein